MSGAAACARLLGERLRALPAMLPQVEARLPRDLLDEDVRARRFVITGGGLSEGPARFLVALLRQRLGAHADFVPQSEFARGLLPPLGDTLVLFSQGLAPNARLPLPHARAFRDTIVFTAVAPDAAAPAGDVRRAAAEAQRAGVRLVILPPEEEGGLLLRVIGPAVHCFAAALWVDRLAARAGLPAAEPSALARVADVYRTENIAQLLGGATLLDGDQLPPIALVAGGRYAEYVFGLRWKLLEGLHVPDPPVWDLLQVAHGPFQQLFDERMTLLVLERAGAPHEAPLIDRLAQVLVPGRHRLIRLGSTLAGACAWFEHDAQLDALVIDAIERRGIDLADWPGKGHDGPLYDVSPETIRP